MSLTLNFSECRREFSLSHNFPILYPNFSPPNILKMSQEKCINAQECNTENGPQGASSLDWYGNPEELQKRERELELASVKEEPLDYEAGMPTKHDVSLLGAKLVTVKLEEPDEGSHYSPTRPDSDESGTESGARVHGEV